MRTTSIVLMILLIISTGFSQSYKLSGTIQPNTSQSQSTNYVVSGNFSRYFAPYYCTKSQNYILTNKQGIAIQTKVSDMGKTVPDKFIVSQNFPNPFNSSTGINFYLPIQGKVEIILVNILGMNVKRITNRFFSSGYHTIIWDVGDLPSGEYYYQFKSGEFTETKKCLLIK